MKLTAIDRIRQEGFALPAILLISTVMLAILVASIGAAAASRVALDSQYYNQLAQLAAESGVARANECLESSGYTPQWSTKANSKDLRPNTDCTGASTLSNPYTLGPTTVAPMIRTAYSIEAPSGSGIGSNLKVTGITELLRTTPLGDGSREVWRQYEHVTYMRIEPPLTIACPAGFISVPGNSAFETSDFCVAKYEAKSVNGIPASVAEGIPYTGISQDEAEAAATNTCDGCHLITEAEWLTVAHNVLNVASNWTGGAVGVGSIYNGHNDNNPATALEASIDDSQGYYGTGNSSGNQRRTLTLSNGQVIWDLAGNLYEWTSGEIGAGKPGGSGLAYREWNAVTVTGSANPSPFPSFGTPAASAWTSSRGIGRLYSNSDDTVVRAFARSAAWSYGDNAGILTLRLDLAPNARSSSFGFRLAR